MARFFVGQRVRLARPVYTGNSNLRGTIRQFLECEYETMAATKVNCLCNWDNGDRDDFYGCGTHTSQLEPILDQHTPCESDFKESLDRLCEDLETENAR